MTTTSNTIQPTETTTQLRESGKPGYKKTKLGWIPEDWDVKELKQISEVVMGHSPLGKSYNKKGVGYPLINGPTEFTERYPIKIQWTTELTKYCQNGDLLLCVRGSSVGRINISNDQYCIGRGVAAIRVEETVNQEYFNQYFFSAIQSLIRKFTAGSTFPNIDSTSIRKITVPVPPLPEQRQIAEILSTWDRAIEKTEQLIAAKEKRKKGLMHQLLTGKVRFPHFNHNWKEWEFGQVFQFLKSSTLSRRNLTFENGHILYFHYGDLHAKYSSIIIDCSKESIPKLLHDIVPPKAVNLLQDGDLIIADASEDYDGVGACIELSNLNGQKAISGLHTLAVRDKDGHTEPSLRGYLLNNPQIASQLKRIATGISVLGITKSNLSKIKISLPSLKEQQKIASVLNACDQEIEQLKDRLDKLKEQKRGLMQGLLSGRIKVF